MKIAVDAGADQLYSMPAPLWKTSWQWVRMTGAAGTPTVDQPVTFNLAPGNHTIRIQTVQAITRLDAIVITNSPTFACAIARG